MTDHRGAVGQLQPESTADNLRVYLREMGSVPLLTRRAEISLARRIERGPLAGAEHSGAVRPRRSRAASTP